MNGAPGGDTARLYGHAQPQETNSIVTTGLIFDIKRFAIHDGPGVRTTVFLKGCPLSCLACHNPEGQSSEPDVFVRADRCNRCGDCMVVCGTDAISVADGLWLSRDRCDLCGSCVDVCLPGALQIAGRRVTVRDVVNELERDIVFYDESGGGATFSGGEPLFQPEFLVELLKACRERGISTCVDTSGHAPQSVFAAIRPLVDLFLYDLKLLDARAHQEFTGLSNGVIVENLGWLAANGGDVVVRLPLLPGVNDDSANTDALGRLLAGLPRRYPVDILPYHNIGSEKYSRLGRTYRLQHTKPPADSVVEAVAHKLLSYGLNITIKGEAYAAE